MDSLSDRTRLIAGATRRGGGRRPVNPPIERASTMLSDRIGDMRDESLGPTYGLNAGSAADALREALADVEGGTFAALVCSGLAAVTVPIMALTRPGDEVLASDAVYGPSRRFLSRWMTPRGVSVRYHPAEATAAQIAALIGERTRLVLIESPASLTFEMIDVPALVPAIRGLPARERRILTLMDNTWGAGLAFKPLIHGVDVSVQAVTKYVSGHSDVLMGSIVATDPALGRAIQDTIEDLGWHVTADDAWLALRGLRTMPLRMIEQARSALTVAEWLQSQAEVSRVLHPVLPDDPGHALWRRDYDGAASLFGIVMKGGHPGAAAAFLNSLSLFGLGWSWGGYESLATHDTDQMAFREAPPALEGELLRLHIGLEHPEELIADLQIGLSAWRAALSG